LEHAYISLLLILLELEQLGSLQISSSWLMDAASMSAQLKNLSIVFVTSSRNESDRNRDLVAKMVFGLLVIEVCCCVVECDLPTAIQSVTMILCEEVPLEIMADPPDAIRVFAVEHGSLKSE